MFFRTTVSKAIVPTSDMDKQKKQKMTTTTTKADLSTPLPERQPAKESRKPSKEDLRALIGEEQQPRAPIFSHPPVPKAEQKSVLVTYILWLVGGVFGLHHLYLRRDHQAFVYWSTLGGYFGVGWLHDAICIPRLVREANLDPRYQDEFNQKLFKEKKPSFSTTRFICAITISYIYAQVVMIAIPEEPVNGWNLLHLHWLIPCAMAAGVWVVGNIGREKGSFMPCLLAAFIVYPIRYVVFDETYWSLATICASALAFDQFSKQWRLEAPVKKSKKVRAVPLVLAIIVYLALLSSFLYFNGKVEDADGNEVPIQEAIQNFLTSPWWTDLKDTWDETLRFAKHNGWAETWKQIVDQLDVGGEQNAYKVLGLSMTATQSEVKTKWRKMSLENHPDKIKDASLRKEAEQRFMEIQQAYEVLSKTKNKRRQKNKQFNDEM